MSEIKTIEIINEAIDLYIIEGESFTAYDVSKEVQNKLAEKNLPFVRHKEMKDDIHNYLNSMINMGLYNRSLKVVSLNKQAYVYHPINHDGSYVQLHPDKTSKTKVKTSKTKATDSKLHTPDSRISLTVPVKFVSKLASIGSKVYVYNHKSPNVLFVSEKNSIKENLYVLIAEYTVDCYGSIRITKKNLNMGFLGVKIDDEFEFEYKNGLVAIRCKTI